jgi:hypothetical protein
MQAQTFCIRRHHGFFADTASVIVRAGMTVLVRVRMSLFIRRDMCMGRVFVSCMIRMIRMTCVIV